jgi:integrase
MWWLVVVTGLRRAELAGLRWADLKLTAATPTLTVRHTRTTAGSVPVEYDPKTRAGRRVLVLDEDTARLVGEHREAMLAEAELVHGRRRLSPHVFVDEAGERYHPTRLTRLLHRLQAEAGLPEITLHDLRHMWRRLRCSRGSTRRSWRSDTATRWSRSPWTATATSSRRCRSPPPGRSPSICARPDRSRHVVAKRAVATRVARGVASHPARVLRSHPIPARPGL